MLPQEQWEEDEFLRSLNREVEQLDNAAFMEQTRLEMLGNTTSFTSVELKRSSENSQNQQSSHVYISRKRKKLSTHNRSTIIHIHRKTRQPTLHDLFLNDLTEKQLDKYLLYLGETYPPENWERSPPVSSPSDVANDQESTPESEETHE